MILLFLQRMKSRALRHILGVKETAFPAYSRLLHVEMVRINECHGNHLTRSSWSRWCSAWLGLWGVH